MSDDTPVSPTTGKPFPKSQTYDGGCHCGKVRSVVLPYPILLHQPLQTLRTFISFSSLLCPTYMQPAHAHNFNRSFTVKLSPPFPEMNVTQCDCSICHTNGHLMVYPLESQITWHSGKDEMAGYTFGPARITHSFCPVCGTSIGGKSNDPNFFANNRAINVSGNDRR